MDNTPPYLYLWICLTLFVSLNGCKSEETLHFNIGATTQYQLDSLFNNYFENDLFHGQVVITRHGKNIYENYLGVANRNWNIPVEHDTKFDIASVNKSMIAALTLKAVEEGKLNLEDRLVHLLSSFSYKGSFHPEINLHHMLNHSSGLADYDGVADALKVNNYLPFKRHRFTNEEYVDFISKIEPINVPGKQFYYSNFAYHLLTIILESTYQKPFSTLLKEKLTLPLGLKNTVSESKNEVVISKLAEAYNYHKESGQWHQNQFIDLSLGRRVFSTASDLNRWAQVMDNPGWLTATSLHLIQQNHLAEIETNYSYGYGWVVIDEQNKSRMIDLGIKQPYIIHGGSTEGYKAMLININSGAFVISFLSNVGNKTEEILLAQKIVTILLN